MAESCGHPMFHFSSAPGRKFSITMSASRASLRTISWPSGARRLSATDFLFRACTYHQSDVPSVHFSPLAQLVAAFRRFDLDHLGAEVREHARTQRPRDERSEFEHFHAVERSSTCFGQGGEFQPRKCDEV